MNAKSARGSYEIPVTALPSDPRPEIQWSLKHGNLQVRNTGNTHVELSDLKFCRPNGSCILQADRMIHVDAAVKFPVKGFSIASFTRSWSQHWFERINIPLDRIEALSQ